MFYRVNILKIKRLIKLGVAIGHGYPLSIPEDRVLLVLGEIVGFNLNEDKGWVLK